MTPMTSAGTDDGFLRATMGAIDLVYNVARRFVRGREDVEDLVQETYLAAFRAWSDHRRPERVEPWLATICVNLARSRHRKAVVRPQEAALSDAVVDTRSAPDNTEEAALEAVDRDALYRALWSLSDEQRIAITLVDLSGLTTSEAADAMGTPRGTVLSRLHRGRRALAAMLTDTTQEVGDR